MMDDRRDMDYRRDIDGLGYPPPPGTRDDASMTIPAIIIAAILIIGGYFVVTYNGDNVRTAANNPAAESSTSAPAPRAPTAAAPAPATTPPSAPAPSPLRRNKLRTLLVGPASAGLFLCVLTRMARATVY